MNCLVFHPGELGLPLSPFSVQESCTNWSDPLTNRILTLVAIFTCLASIPGFIRLLPFLIDGLSRARANSDMEHNVNTARMRKSVSYLLLLPFCLMASRYGLYRPAFSADIPFEWNSVFVLGAFLCFLILRFFCYQIGRPNVGNEAAGTIHHTMNSYFIILVFLWGATCILMTLLRCPDDAIRIAMLSETALMLTIGWIRTAQILSFYCAGLTTFLYLCSLEIIPTGILFASGMVL